MTTTAKPLSSESGSAVERWIEQRTGLDSIARIALDEPIPGGARWAYVFGSGLLFLFISQILTGMALALYYVPAVNDAHVTVAYIIKVVTAGSFLRSMHSYGASAVIVVLLLHIIQTYFYGAYKGPRELVWLAGCALFALMLGMAFTGYLLPWDQKAYFATAVGTNVMGEMPGGNVVKQLLRGGNQLGTVTLSRFFVLHVFVIPSLIVLMIVAHIYLFRKAGPAGPIEENPVTPKLPTERFFPRQLVMDTMFALLIALTIGGLSYFYPVQLGPQANPADAAFLPRPEWYFLPMFQWLKLWPGKSALIGVGVLPAIVTFLFVGVPFLDRGLKRHPLQRPIAIGGFCIVLGGMVGFGVLSHLQDQHDPAVANQLAKQERAIHAFMNSPFVPENVGASAAAPPAPAVAPAAPAASADGSPSVTPGKPVKPGAVPPVAPVADQQNKKPAAPADPLVEQGKTFYTSDKYMCSGCHGDKGEGTVMYPKIAGKKLSADDISDKLQHPSDVAQDAGMPTVPASNPDLKALIAFVKSLQ
jgi:ubiquinol-cytochrome c reductase cytochrome b subunit